MLVFRECNHIARYHVFYRRSPGYQVEDVEKRTVSDQSGVREFARLVVHENYLHIVHTLEIPGYFLKRLSGEEEFVVFPRYEIVRVSGGGGFGLSCGLVKDYVLVRGKYLAASCDICPYAAFDQPEL